LPGKSAIWSPSDIRDWDRESEVPPELLAAPSRALSPTTLVRVRIGSEEWTTKLQWVADLLSDAEMAAFREAAESGNRYGVSRRSGRAAFTIEVEAPP
jgi:cell division inhibitor SulA